MVANILKVKVYPKDFKAIPDILPYNKLLQGDPVELELDKREIQRCMNFGDVFDLTTGEEVLIDEITFKEIVEYVEETEDEGEDTEEVPEGGSEENGTTPKTSDTEVVDPTESTVTESEITEPEEQPVQ